MRKNKKYSPELKIVAVKSYLAGEITSPLPRDENLPLLCSRGR